MIYGYGKLLWHVFMLNILCAVQFLFQSFIYDVVGQSIRLKADHDRTKYLFIIGLLYTMYISISMCVCVLACVSTCVLTRACVLTCVRMCVSLCY